MDFSFNSISKKSNYWIFGNASLKPQKGSARCIFFLLTSPKKLAHGDTSAVTKSCHRDIHCISNTDKQVG